MAQHPILEAFHKQSKLSSQKRPAGMTAKTHRFYSHYLNQYLVFLESDPPSRSTFVEWLTSRQLARSTKHTIACGLGRFFRVLGAFDHDDQVLVTQSFRYTPSSWSEQTMTQEMVIGMLRQSSKRTQRLAQARNPFITVLLATIGCRRGQITGMNCSDIRIDGKGNKIYISLLRQKANEYVGGGEYDIKNIPLGYTVDGRKLSDVYLSYLIERAAYTDRSKDDSLFISLHGDRLTEAYITKYIKEDAAALGYVGITPHSFRHYVGHRVANEHGVGIAAALLGHSSFDTTMKYMNKNMVDFSSIYQQDKKEGNNHEQ